jgi:glycosyltransferase involved in cell wall biosynthesis
VPQRVAIVVPTPVPYREPLFRMLAERARVDPHVIYLAASGAGWDQRSDWAPARAGYSSEVLESRQWARAGRSAIAVPRGLGEALEGARPDRVVSWEFGPATWRALAWARGRVPLIVFSELTPWSDPELTAAQRRVHGLLAPRMAGFIVASSQGAERLRRLGVSPDRIEVALQSADLAAVAPAPRRDGPVRVLSVGRLVRDKNLGLLVDAFADAGFAEGEAELVIAGTGPLEAELGARIASSGAPARLAGGFAPSDLATLYAEAHAFALVSSYEPFGVTLREAAAAGLPLLASERAGAVGDLAVLGENALVVDPESREQVASALRRLERDPELRARLAEGSLAVSRRHPLEADAEAWERAAGSAAPRARSSPGRPRA